MSLFYQIIDFQEDLNLTKQKLSNAHYNYNELHPDECNILLIPIAQHDYSILKNQSIKSLLLNNNSFIRLISKSGYNVRDIDFIGGTEEDIKQQLIEIVNKEDYEIFLSILNEYDLHIKKISFFIEENRIITVFDSGVIFIPRGDITDIPIRRSLENLLLLIRGDNCGA